MQRSTTETHVSGFGGTSRQKPVKTAVLLLKDSILSAHFPTPTLHCSCPAQGRGHGKSSGRISDSERWKQETRKSKMSHWLRPWGSYGRCPSWARMKDVWTLDKVWEGWWCTNTCSFDEAADLMGLHGGQKLAWSENMVPVLLKRKYPHSLEFPGLGIFFFPCVFCCSVDGEGLWAIENKKWSKLIKSYILNVHVLVLCVLSRVRLFATPWRFICLWDSPGKNTRVGCHFLLQGIFLTQGLNPGLLYISCIDRWILGHRATREAPLNAHNFLYIFDVQLYICIYLIYKYIFDNILQ